MMKGFRKVTAIFLLFALLFTMTAGCKIPPELQEWMQQQFPIYPATTGWLTANLADWRQQGNKLLEQWLYGYIDDATFAQKLNEYSQADADAIIDAMDLDTTGWNIVP